MNWVYEGTAWQLPFGEEAELDYRSGPGEVVILPVGLDEEPRLEAVGRGADSIEAHVSRVGRTVRVTVESASRGGHRHREDMQIVMHVPRDVHARLSTGAGSIEVQDLQDCELDIQSGAGRIALSHVFGRINLSLGAGQIAGANLGGSLNARTNAGAILMEIDALDPGRHEFRSGAGAVRLVLARDLDARVEVHARRSGFSCRFPSRPSAAAVVDISADGGSVRAR